MPRIAALLVYPLESCRGIRVKSVAAGPLGLEGDCQYRITDDAGVAIGAEALAGIFVQQHGEELWVSAAGHERLVLPSGLPAADAWFSRLLGKPAKCVARSADQPVALRVTTTTSLVRLNQALPEAIGIERFSTNVVLEGTLPLEEDRWQSVSVGGAHFLAQRPGEGRLPFGVELHLEPGAREVQLRPGQTLEVKLLPLDP